MVSVTPTGLESTMARALAFMWSAGHSPAVAADDGSKRSGEGDGKFKTVGVRFAMLGHDVVSSSVNRIAMVDRLEVTHR